MLCESAKLVTGVTRLQVTSASGDAQYFNEQTYFRHVIMNVTWALIEDRFYFNVGRLTNKQHAHLQLTTFIFNSH